jgi:hypothetical protein
VAAWCTAAPARAELKDLAEADGRAPFTIGPPAKTLWYEVVWE